MCSEIGLSQKARHLEDRPSPTNHFFFIFFFFWDSLLCSKKKKITGKIKKFRSCMFFFFAMPPSRVFRFSPVLHAARRACVANLSALFRSTATSSAKGFGLCRRALDGRPRQNFHFFGRGFRHFFFLPRRKKIVFFFKGEKKKKWILKRRSSPRKTRRPRT